MFGWIDCSIYEISVLYGFCFFNSTSFSNDDFSSFTNSTKEARLLRNEEAKIKLSQLIIQIYKLSLTALRTKASCESQARYPSHDFTSKSEQNKPLIFLTEIYTNEDDGSTVWHPCVVCGAMHSGKNWRRALWLNAVYSGKKWSIREFVSPSIYSS